MRVVTFKVYEDIDKWLDELRYAGLARSTVIRAGLAVLYYVLYGEIPAVLRGDVEEVLRAAGRYGDVFAAAREHVVPMEFMLPSPPVVRVKDRGRVKVIRVEG